MTIPPSAAQPRCQQHQMMLLQNEIAQLQRELADCRAREQHARLTAQVDALTGLPNRRLFDERIHHQLARHVERQRQLALLFLDLDDFKTVNDRHGHATGDAMLRLVAQRLQHAMRRHDLACRLGGDEFVCVLLDLPGEDELIAIQQKLAAAVSQPCQLGDQVLQVQPSMGAALFPRDGLSVEALLAHADRSMYRHKRRQLRLVPGGAHAVPGRPNKPSDGAWL